MHSGTATGTGSWDIHFKQAGRFLQADGTTVDTAHNGSAPLSTTTTTNDTMTVTVDLAYPGDGVLLEAIVENSGTIPATLTSFTIDNDCDDLEVTQAAGGPTEDETLAANGGTIKYGKLYRGEALDGTNTVRPIKLWLHMLSILDSVLHTVILHLFQ